MVVQLILTHSNQNVYTMPEQIGKEPVQYFKALSLLNALKRKNLLAMAIGNYVIKGSGTKAI